MNETAYRCRQSASGFTSEVTAIVRGQRTARDPIAEIEPLFEHLDQRQMSEPFGVVEDSEISVRRHRSVATTGVPKIAQPSQSDVPCVGEWSRRGRTTVRRLHSRIIGNQGRLDESVRPRRSYR